MVSYLHQHTFETPLGKMVTCATAEGVYLLSFNDQTRIEESIQKIADELGLAISKKTNGHILKLTQELAEYFNGTLTEFTVPLVLDGTPFQQSVWKELQNVPYGVTRSYKQQTAVLGDPKAIRAVATANGKNKLAIVVPCHRIIGSDGSLTGYAGGLERKRFLLNLERKHGGPIDLFST